MHVCLKQRVLFAVIMLITCYVDMEQSSETYLMHFMPIRTLNLSYSLKFQGGGL